MNYAGSETINNIFHLNEDGEIACDTARCLVNNSMQRAYIFANMFFYDITEREVNKIRAKIKKTYEVVIGSTEFDPEDVDHLFPNISARFATEVGNNSLDPLIKLELANVKTTMMLQLTKAEKKAVDQIYISIFNTEVAKFKKALLITQDNKGKPYEITLSEKYVQNLPPRCKRILKPTIKMLAYMDGLQFETFEIDYNYKITYTWSNTHPKFDEESLKDQIKEMIAGRNPNTALPNF